MTTDNLNFGTASDERPTFDVVVDAGNANVKACLVRGRKILRTAHYPSLLRFTKDHLLVYGGFSLGNESGIVGRDCENRNDTIVVGDDSQGKLKYLKYLYASVCSAFDRALPVGSHLRFHVLTLSVSSVKEITNAVKALENLSVDNVPKQFTTEVAQILPEGAGCSLYTANAFKKAKDLSVLDIGGGTINLSQYVIDPNENTPRRDTFAYHGSGVYTFTEHLLAILTNVSTNGRVDERLVKFALQSNSYKLLDSYQGTDISQHVREAATQWSNLPKVKEMLTQAGYIISTGGCVGACGGGFKIHALRETIEACVLAGLPEDARSRFLIPEEADVLGVVGIAKELVNQFRRNERKLKEKETDGQPKPKRSRKAKDEQRIEGASEGVAPVPSASESEQPTSGGTDEHSALGVATSDEHPAHAETTTEQG